VKKFREEEVDKSWLIKIRAWQNFCHPTRTVICLNVILPLNSSLKKEVIGLLMPNQNQAKRSTAMEACIKLHEQKEFDDGSSSSALKTCAVAPLVDVY